MRIDDASRAFVDWRGDARQSGAGWSRSTCGDEKLREDVFRGYEKWPEMVGMEDLKFWHVR